MHVQAFTILLAFALCPFIASEAQTIANAGPDQGTCFDTTSMQANTPLPTELGYWTLTSGSATIADASDPTTFVTGIDYGQNVLTWTIITLVDTTADQVSITRYWVDPGIPNAGPDQMILAPPFTATMMATQPIFPQVCTWSLVQGTGTISNPTHPYSQVSDLGVGMNVFQWTCDNSPCNPPGVDEVVITVQLSTSIGVDANNHPVAMWFDQASGVLKIVGDVQANSLSIVNALGQRVETHARPSAGSLDLSGLPPGSYAATATFSGTRRTLRFVVER